MGFLTKRREEPLDPNVVNGVSRNTASSTKEVRVILDVLIQTGSSEGEIEKAGELKIGDHYIRFRTKTRVKLG